MRLPKIGEIRFRLTCAIPADIRNLTVSYTLGWHVAFCCAVEIEERQPLAVAAGIDRGVANSIPPRAVKAGRSVYFAVLADIIAPSPKPSAKERCGKRFGTFTASRC